MGSFTRPSNVGDHVGYTEDTNLADVYTVTVVHKADVVKDYTYDIQLDTAAQVVYRDVPDGYIKPPAGQQQPTP